MTSILSREALRPLVESELARRDLATFMRRMGYETPRHIEYLAELLERAERGEIKRVAISAPPGHGKSTLLQAFVAWFLGRDPKRRILCISASESLAKRNSRDTQRLVTSDAWPWPSVTLANDSVFEWSTVQGGDVRAIGKGGVLTGFRAELILCDDLQADAGSDATRASDAEWFRSVLSTRLEPGGICVAIQTRWHDQDIIGSILEGESADQWTYVNLPVFAEENDLLARATGEVLWPERWSAEAITAKKAEVGSSAFAAQYLGDPVPAGGAIFKSEWFERRWQTRMNRYTGTLCMSIDGAWSAKSSADASAIALWGTDGRDYYLLECVAERLEFPDLTRRVSELYRQWKPHILLAEAAASGIPLVQELARSSSVVIQGIPPKGDKVARAMAITPLFEVGRVLLPPSAVDEWILEHLRFPHGRNDDRVDTTSLALAWLHEFNLRALVERQRATQWQRFSTAR